MNKHMKVHYIWIHKNIKINNTVLTTLTQYNQRTKWSKDKVKAIIKLLAKKNKIYPI